MLYLWKLVQVLIAYNLILPVCLFFVYKLRSIVKKDYLSNPEASENDYAIIVTAYEQTDQIPALVRSVLNLNYEHFLVYIVADKCDISTLSFAAKEIVLLQPEQTLASNIASHLYAVSHFQRNHTHIAILDSDNLVHQDFLSELDTFFKRGYKAVQGIRKPKNLNTTYACLDAARDLYYQYYDGKILFGSGSSATLAGSGMAFETGLYQECINNIRIQGAGFDKVLQYEIVSKGMRIAFAEKAIVFDEKTAATAQLVNQRSRWIRTWFQYFTFGFKLLPKAVKNTNTNQLLFGLILLRPPLFIFLTLAIICILANIWIAPLHGLTMLAALGCFIISFCIPIFKRTTDQRIYASLLDIPKFIYYQITALLKVRQTHKLPVTTKHFNPINLEDIP